MFNPYLAEKLGYQKMAEAEKEAAQSRLVPSGYPAGRMAVIALAVLGGIVLVLVIL